MRSRKASPKNVNFGWIFDAKMEGLECRKPSWRVVRVTIYTIPVVREKASKMEGKRHPKVMPKSTFWRSGGRFFRFWEVFGEV